MAIDLQQTQGQMFGPAGANHAPGLVPDPGSTSHSPPYLLGDDGDFHQVTGGGAFVMQPAGPGHAAGIVPDPGATAHTPPYYLGDDAAFHPLWMVANVMDYGATGNGVTDDTSAINSAIAALPANGGTLYFPAGTYLISSTLAIPSNTKVLGEGWGSTIKGKSGFTAYAPFIGATAYFLMTNNNYTSGNTNIIIESLAFSWTNMGATAGTHNVHLRNVTYARVTNCRFESGNDGLCFTASKYFVGEGNFCVDQNAGGAGLDMFDGCSDGAYIGNVINNNSLTNGYGITCTGVSVTDAANTTSRIKIIGNTIVNTALTGIWVQGGSDGVSVVGSTEDVVVADNTIDTCDIGIRVSESVRTVVTGNHITNSQHEGIDFAAELLTTGQYCVVSSNSVNNANLSLSATAAAIHFQNTAINNSVFGNIVNGTKPPYSILFDTGATGNTVSDNSVVAGTSGTIGNGAGITNLILSNVSGALTINNWISLQGGTSGTVTIATQAAAGTYNFNLPTIAGAAGNALLSQAGGSNAMTWTDQVTFGTGIINLGVNGGVSGEILFSGATSGSNQIVIDTTGGALRTAGALGSNTELFSGLTGTSAGSLLLLGTSGVISIQPQAAAGTYNFNLPTTAGTAGQFLTSQGGSSSAMTWTSVGTFQDWTPTLSSQSGTIGTTTINTARYTQVGNLVHFYLDISITSAGSSPAGYFEFTLPVTPAASTVVGSCSGLETQNTTTLGGDVLGSGSGSIGHLVATGASPNIMLNSNRIVAFGMYET